MIKNKPVPVPTWHYSTKNIPCVAGANPDYDNFNESETMFLKPSAIHKQELDLYISGDILEPEHYIQRIQMIRDASKDDIIYVRINSSGGHLDTALQLRKALLTTEAKVVTSIEGMCCSAATMLFLCGDVFEVSPEAIFMIHDYSGGMYGKGNEMYIQAKFMHKWSRQFYISVYNGFLTSKEIDNICHGVDIWLTPEEVLLRLKEEQQ